jgi:hypothetical protein
VLADRHGFTAVTDALASAVEGADLIAGIDARGFLVRTYWSDPHRDPAGGRPQPNLEDLGDSYGAGLASGPRPPPQPDHQNHQVLRHHQRGRGS